MGSYQTYKFEKGDSSGVHSNSVHGRLVCKQHFTGVSSVCSVGSSLPVTTAEPSTHDFCCCNWIASVYCRGKQWMTETPESGSSENPDRKRPSNTMSSPFRSNLVFVSFTNSGSETLPRDFITTSRRVPGIKPFSLRSQISPGSSSGATMVMSLAKNAVSCLFKYSKKNSFKLTQTNNLLCLQDVWAHQYYSMHYTSSLWDQPNSESEDS